MLDDVFFDFCNGKHQGPVLHTDREFIVMRCSFCEEIFREPNPETQKKKSSKTCIHACDWVVCDKLVSCNSCGYRGPLP
ncbi:MAG: hypothetical protein K2X27_24520 [Candidatus Obscuribacterales bacterium]|nr:hypothetical protein [Candidatus Obscuribacterales bacterium]